MSLATTVTMIPEAPPAIALPPRPAYELRVYDLGPPERRIGEDHAHDLVEARRKAFARAASFMGCNRRVDVIDQHGELVAWMDRGQWIVRERAARRG